jgi:hypothetical protein
MRLDSGNRSFLTLLLTGVALYLVLSAAACVLLSLLAFRLATEGTTAFGEAPWVVLPAAAFLALISAGGVLGVRSLGAQVASSRRLDRRIRELRRAPPAGLVEVGIRTGLADRLHLIDATAPFSFTYRAIRPVVVVSRGLLESASDSELEAVLVHERYHVRNRDPLKVVLARSLSRGFFFLPALRELEERYLAGRELAADRRALERCGRGSLVNALLKVVRGPDWPELSTAAAVGGTDFLGVRVAQLESGREPALAGPSRRTLVVTAAALMFLAASLAVALAGLGGLASALNMSHGDMGSAGLGAVMAAGCAAPWAIVGWLTWRWFSA